MRSGKNTVADIITAYTGAKQFAFGTAIGDVIHRYFPEAFETGKPRKHYQSVGQWFRQLNPEIWINEVDRQLKQLDAGTPIVITDCRQANEYQWLKDNGFYIVKVVTASSVREARMIQSNDVVSAEDLNHETEQFSKQLVPDFTIYNNGSLAELDAEVVRMLSCYLSSNLEKKEDVNEISELYSSHDYRIGTVSQ